MISILERAKLEETKFKCREHIKEHANYGNIVITESFIKSQQIEKIFQDSRWDFRIRLMKLLVMNLKKMETSQTKRRNH